jgi:hypothetical protein
MRAGLLPHSSIHTHKGTLMLGGAEAFFSWPPLPSDPHEQALELSWPLLLKQQSGAAARHSILAPRRRALPATRGTHAAAGPRPPVPTPIPDSFAGVAFGEALPFAWKRRPALLAPCAKSNRRTCFRR